MLSYNFYVYITTNAQKTVLYIGVTNDLNRRLAEHHANKGISDTYAGKYFCYNLVYYEHYIYINQAIAREKELKRWRREKKDALIRSMNPDWVFLNAEVAKL